jgi:hypothetical protein
VGIRKHEPTGRTGRRLVGALLLLFAVVPSSADEPEILSFTIEPNPVGRGDRFGILILMDYPNPEGLTVREPQLPEGLEIRGGPSLRPATYDSADGLRKAVSIGYTLRGNVTGRTAVGSFEIESAEGEIVKTPERLVSIGLYRNRRLYIPLEVEWVGVPDRAYVGQAIPVIVGLQRQTSISGIDRVAIERPGNGVFAEAAGVGDIESTTVGDATLFNLPAAAYIWTPATSGRATLPSCSVTVGDLTGWSPEERVAVMPLPDQVVSTGAVGWFDFRASVDTTSVMRGEEVILFLRIEGRGNLNYLQVPDPRIDTAVQTSRDEISDFQPSMYGYTGSRFIEYRYLPDETAAEIFIDVPDFSWVQPNTEEVHRTAGDVFRVGIRAEGEIEEDSDVREFPFEPESVEELTGVLLSYRYRDRENLLWLIPGFLFFLVFLILPKQVLPLLFLVLLFGGIPFVDRAGPTGPIQADPEVEPSSETYATDLVRLGRNHYDAGEFAEAADAYALAARVKPDLPGLLYNESLALYRSGDVSGAVTQVWKALVQVPGRMKYRRLLKWIESEEGLHRQLPPPFRLHPEIPYWAGIVLLNALFVVATLHRRSPKGITLILLISISALVLLAATGFTITGLSRNRAVAVVVSEESGTEVKRIPKETTDEWFRFPAGQTLYVKGKSGRLFLVKTADGLLGWVDQEALMWVTRFGFGALDRIDIGREPR